MFSSTWISSASASSSSTAATSPPIPDVYELTEEYGEDAAAKISRILQALETAGFLKAHVNSYRAFDRILSGMTWLIHRIVRREYAERGRIQWNVLYQSYEKMKPRLGFAQEVVRCIEALDAVCPVTIQPHQLLLQDFGDIETVEKLVVWLINEGQNPHHLEKIQRERMYVHMINIQQHRERVTPIKKEVAFLLHTYAPKRRWQYIQTGDEKQDESEDALIQRCLLEYGERMTVAIHDDQEVITMERQEEGKDVVDCMAQIASQAAAIASGEISKPRRASMKGLRRRTIQNDLAATDFDQQFQKARKQAIEMQRDLVNQRREREVEFLQRVVSAPEVKQDNTDGRIGSSMQSPLDVVRVQLQEHEVQVQTLIKEKRMLDAKTKDSRVRATALDEALDAVKLEIKEVEAQTPKDTTNQEYVAKLHELLQKKEELKREKNEFRAKCRLEVETLKERIEKLKLQVADDANEDTLRLNEIEHMHAQMAQKYKDMKLAAAKQTRAVHLKMKQIDEIPARIELVQYEKRFVELYDEVALTLDETRKYYCIYNTIKTTHEFLEKEISLINSISENFDTAMSSKTATQAFFMQIENIIQSVRGTLSKQQAVRDDHQFSLETLESKYKLLLEHERKYVNAICEFQKECEKNEKLLIRLQELVEY
ncbi:unnamed protein product [Peronospora belbahrii]|uniref:CCDC93 coiled-coil domain-containing protein n=1 Tax=Peronospora belbahrii TaxID=622444 RepID=A0AAU9LAU0_9STRA|nr:unnamed protein product [Peronospora belbahrii]CAH0516064.1 unnamed protein product [Peronospora belbahrii]